MKKSKGGARKEFFQAVLLQVYFTYVQSFYLLVVAGFGVGVVMALQAQIGLSFLGKMESLGQILNTIVFREVTPLFITILIIIRSITAITSELATMKVNDEILALEVMGLEVEEFLIRPRIVAGSISFFCMATTFFFIAVIGFWAGLSINSNVPLGTILYFFVITIRPAHIIFFVIKTVLIGAIIVRRACTYGLSLKKASFEVPIVTNKSVVECLILGVSLQVLISSFAYFILGVGI